MKLLEQLRFPSSLGLLYSAFTYYLGFKVNSAEYKVMGLAPYGKPVHFERIMKDMVQEAMSILTAGRELEGFGRLLHESWQAKRELSSAGSAAAVAGRPFPPAGAGRAH